MDEIKEQSTNPKEKLQYFYLCAWMGGIGDLAISLWFHYSTITEKNIQRKPIFLLDFKTNNKLGNFNCYNINLSEILSLKQDNIICDSNAIEQILNQHKNNISKPMFNSHYFENITEYTNKIVCLNPRVLCGKRRTRALGFFLNSIVFKKDVLHYFRDKIKQLPSNIVFIQIRYTDRTCNYKKYLSNNNDFLNKYDTFYVATDNIGCINYLRKTYPQKLFYNFTTFKNKRRNNLHHITSIPGHVKLKDVFFDLCMANKAVAYFSCSRGGFAAMTKWSHKLKLKCFRL